MIAHCGYPWFLDAAEVVYKNANVWAPVRDFRGDEAAFAALAARGGLREMIERLREALEYAERPTGSCMAATGRWPRWRRARPGRWR